jgi:hypothetical protein
MLFSAYIMKTYAALTYVVVFWLLALAVQHYQAEVLPDSDGLNPPFWDNFGLSCISNVLMGSLYLLVYMGEIAFRKVYCAASARPPTLKKTMMRRNPASLQSPPPPSEGTFCVEEEEEELTRMEESERRVSAVPVAPEAAAAVCSTIELPVEAEHASDTIVLRVTPGLLWYYMYTTGWGVFCMAYTLHGAHWVSSLCLCAGSLFCGVWSVLRTRRELNTTSKRMAMIFLAVVNVTSVCACTSLICTQQKLLWRSWVVEIACPLLAPFWLLESKDKMMPMNMPKQSMVLFGLPFTSMISAGYLSMYIPLQECVSSVSHANLNSSSSSVPLNASSSSGTSWTPLVTEKVLLGHSAWGLFLCGAVVPGLMYSGFVLYASAFQKVDMQLLCANSLWMILAARLWMHAGDAFASIACMALLGWFTSLLFVLLHHFERDTFQEWQDMYGDILLADDHVPPESS